jgi:hypothetical protein
MAKHPDLETQPNMLTAAANEAINATVHATARLIPNFAWQHLKAATIFRDHVIQLEKRHLDHPFGSFFEDIRSYASGCIMSSAASLEALINELFIAHDSPLRLKLADFEADFWGKNGIERKPILDKYQFALDMLQCPLFDEHQTVYRDAWALIELRNALVHYKPTWDPERRRQIELVEVLAERFQPSPFPDSGSDFVTMKCMGSGCVRWSVDTTLNLMREFDARTSLDPNKMTGFWKLGN